MRFGIVVTDIRQAVNAANVMKEALSRDWSVRCFLTDDGVNMLKDAPFVQLARNERAHLSVCEHSVERYCQDLDLKVLNDAVIVGGQYQNAELVRNSDRVMVF